MPTRPDLRAAFLSVYGRDLPAPETAFLDAMTAFNAAATITWAHRHGEHDYAARYGTLLRRLSAARP
ncbi:hypothetical protein [Deinococcus maricopensis]|uniref:hypothetical protein n=1 Tax=Deinococcus maricopensis TaxID=309887 RepID=UPI0002DC56E6|nr:hypothetical protein [Deinococcus maricopensis]